MKNLCFVTFAVISVQDKVLSSNIDSIMVKMRLSSQSMTHRPRHSFPGLQFLNFKQAKSPWLLHPDDWDPPMASEIYRNFCYYCFFKMEKRMLNTHPEMFNGDYEVEFPLDENQIVKRFDYGDIPVRNSKHFVSGISFAAYQMPLLAL